MSYQPNLKGYHYLDKSVYKVVANGHASKPKMEIHMRGDKLQGQLDSLSAEGYTKITFTATAPSFTCHFGTSKPYATFDKEELAQDWLYTRTSGKEGKLWVKPISESEKQAIRLRVAEAEISRELDATVVTMTPDQIRNFRLVMAMSMGPSVLLLDDRGIQYLRDRLQDRIDAEAKEMEAVSDADVIPE